MTLTQRQQHFKDGLNGELLACSSIRGQGSTLIGMVRRDRCGPQFFTLGMDAEVSL